MEKNSTKKIVVAGTALILLGLAVGDMSINYWRNMHGAQKEGANTAAQDGVVMNNNSSWQGKTADNNTATPAPTADDATSAANTDDQARSRVSNRYSKPRARHAAQASAKDGAAEPVVAAVMPMSAQPAITDATEDQTSVTEPVSYVKTTGHPPVYATFAEKTRNYHRKAGSVNIAPELGVNIYGAYHNQENNTLFNGWHAGAMVDVCLNDHVSLQPGLMYITKGNQTHTVSADADGSTKTTVGMHYLEMPLNIVYKVGDWRNARFIVGAGPYAAYLFSTKTSNGTELTTNSVPSDGSPATSKATTYNNMDYGVGGFIGCEMPKGLYVKAGGELGLSNTQTDADKNYGFLLSMGYIIH